MGFVQVRGRAWAEIAMQKLDENKNGGNGVSATGLAALAEVCIPL